MIRPEAARDTGPKLKLHRRVLRLDGKDHTVLTLRPGTQARFATNRHHETWHVLSDGHGGRLLGRLLWGLSYQRVPNTLVLIDRPFLDPNPFDAEPSDPIVLAPSTLTPLTARAARQLRRLLPLRGNPDGTVRLQTHGLHRRLEQVEQYRADPWRDYPGQDYTAWLHEWEYPNTRCVRHGGVLLFTAPPAVLRTWAAGVHELADWFWHGQSSCDFGWGQGEVQVWDQYHRMVSAARTARREVLAGPVAGSTQEEVRELIWPRSEAHRERMIQGFGRSK